MSTTVAHQERSGLVSPCSIGDDDEGAEEERFRVHRGAKRSWGGFGISLYHRRWGSIVQAAST